MIYAYLRVSTDKQDFDAQKLGVDDFAKNKGWIIDEYITDNGVSGAKDPAKRHLGSLLAKLKKGDKLIAAEISRLGRDLLMVMEILNHCMKEGCVVYTVKDNYVLGDDVQSKVLAFAFGLSAEIERKMIQARTKEGLVRRVQRGVLLGRPYGKENPEESLAGFDKKEDIIMQYDLGVSISRIAKNLGLNRVTVTMRLVEWGKITEERTIKSCERTKQKRREQFVLWAGYRADPISLTREQKEKIIVMIKKDLPIPEIHKEFSEYPYQRVYDTIFINKDLNTLYREHGHKLLVKTHNRVKEKK